MFVLVLSVEGLAGSRLLRRLRTGSLTRMRERAGLIGNGPTYLARDTNVRICRNEYFIRAHIYALPRILTHDSLDLINDRRAAFSTVLVRNQIAESALMADQLPGTPTAPLLTILACSSARPFHVQ